MVRGGLCHEGAAWMREHVQGYPRQRSSHREGVHLPHPPDAKAESSCKIQNNANLTSLSISGPVPIIRIQKTGTTGNRYVKLRCRSTHQAEQKTAENYEYAHQGVSEFLRFRPLSPESPTQAAPCFEGRPRWRQSAAPSPALSGTEGIHQSI